MKFVKIYRVRSSEITPEYLLKEYFAGMYFQECFAEYATSKNAAAFDVAKSGLTWLTSHARAKFFHPMPFWRSEVEVSSWVRKAGAARMFVNFEARHENRVVAIGESVQLIADAETHRPRKISEIAGRFETEYEDVFSEPFGNFSSDFDCDNPETAQAVRFDDLDFNMHLNNVKYIPRALEALDLNFRISHSLLGYRIKYEKEARFGDRIESFASGKNGVFRHLLRNEKDGSKLCEMESYWIKKTDRP